MRLLGAFNRTDAVAVPDAASAVPAISAEGSLPSAAEAVAVAVLAEFRRKAKETRELHSSSPGAGEGNCSRFVTVVIDTSHTDLTVSAVPRFAWFTSPCAAAAYGADSGAPVAPALSGNQADNGRPFDASEQQTGQHRGINEPWAVGTPVGLCRISIGLRPARPASRACSQRRQAAWTVACRLAGGSSAAAHAHRWPSRPHRQHLFLAVREISGCDLRRGPLAL